MCTHITEEVFKIFHHAYCKILYLVVRLVLEVILFLWAPEFHFQASSPILEVLSHFLNTFASVNRRDLYVDELLHLLVKVLTIQQVYLVSLI